MTSAEQVQLVFNEYCDFVTEEIEAAGVPADMAVEVLFETAALLAEDGTMPEFPDDTKSWHDMAEWLLAATKADFRGIVAKALKGN